MRKYSCILSILLWVASNGEIAFSRDGTGSSPARMVHHVPFSSSGNAIEITVLDASALVGSEFEVRAVDVPSWLSYRSTSIVPVNNPRLPDRVARFEFSLGKSAPVGTESELRFEVVSPSGQRWSKIIRIVVDTPSQFELFQNYPNPFNPSTVFSYALPVESHVTLTIYNLLGQTVETLIEADQSAGYHEEIWNPRNVSNGVYFYQLTWVDQNSMTHRERKRLTILK